MASRKSVAEIVEEYDEAVHKRQRQQETERQRSTQSCKKSADKVNDSAVFFHEIIITSLNPQHKHFFTQLYTCLNSLKLCQQISAPEPLVVKTPDNKARRLTVSSMSFNISSNKLRADDSSASICSMRDDASVATLQEENDKSRQEIMNPIRYRARPTITESSDTSDVSSADPSSCHSPSDSPSEADYAAANRNNKTYDNSPANSYSPSGEAPLSPPTAFKEDNKQQPTSPSENTSRHYDSGSEAHRASSVNNDGESDSDASDSSSVNSAKRDFLQDSEDSDVDRLQAVHDKPKEVNRNSIAKSKRLRFESDPPQLIHPASRRNTADNIVVDTTQSPRITRHGDEHDSDNSEEDNSNPFIYKRPFDNSEEYNRLFHQPKILNSRSYTRSNLGTNTPLRPRPSLSSYSSSDYSRKTAKRKTFKKSLEKVLILPLLNSFKSFFLDTSNRQIVFTF